MYRGLLNSKSKNEILLSQQHNPVHFKMKKLSNNSYFYIIVTDNAQVRFVLIEDCQPGGAAINFPKIAWNQN